MPQRAWIKGAVVEALVLVVAFLAYFTVRVLVRDADNQALANAARVMRLESALHISWERPLQSAALLWPPLIHLFNTVYALAYWPGLAGSLLFLYLRRSDAYRRMRTALIVSGALGLVLFTCFPLAPPRLTAASTHDTIATFDKSLQQAARPSQFTNQYAAMPSFHFGWTLLCGICVAMSTRRRSLQVLLGLKPAVMLLAIVVTGNHYIIDGIVGGGLVLLGLAVYAVARGRTDRQQRRPERSARVPVGPAAECR